MVGRYAHILWIEKHRGDPEFRRKLRLGLVQLLETIRDRAIAACTEDGEPKPNRIVLSTPATWGPEFEDVYAEIITDVFQVNRGSIDFLAESEAFMHAMSRDEELSKKLMKQVSPKTRLSALVVDCGGHNLVSSLSHSIVLLD